MEREYKDREIQWEIRERDRERMREKDLQIQKREKDRESRDLNFDDSDRKRRTKEWQYAKRERERERQEDEADRLKEIQAEEFRRREEQRKAELEEQKAIQAQLEREVELQKEREKKEKEREERKERERLRREREREREKELLNPLTNPSRSPVHVQETAPAEAVDPTALGTIAFSAPIIVNKSVVAVVPGFNPEEKVDDAYQKKKRKLVTLETSIHEEESKEAKLELAKSIIESIPVEKDKLFEFPVDWTIVDKHNIAENKMRTWITKKTVELLKSEDATLISFIVNKIAAHKGPIEIGNAVGKVLLEDTDGFVVRLWRAFLYEVILQTKMDEREAMKRQKIALAKG
eukprot:TRINITY_DN3928_c0_g2_i1.p1 TRINITY_DN3928_c0_g2~~TRINITY_DN3928_c0_g2_i1.p1  ORF type:complete len:348 (-),score=143.50 TRINITY_DN3928_c0_g2_i1:73-1116(-)